MKYAHGMMSKALATTAAMMFAGAVYAGSVTIPNTFASGTPAKAQEVNDNFDAVATAINDNAADITANTNALAVHATGIDANTAAIDANALKLPAVAAVDGTHWIQLGGAAATLQSITFTPPASGFVMVTAAGTVTYTDSSVASLGGVYMDLADTADYVGGATPMAATKSATRWQNIASSADSLGYHLVEVIPVTGGQSYTWYLNGMVSGTDSVAFLFQPIMTALFIPNGM